MKIDGVNSSKVINLYSAANRNVVRKSEAKASDTITISSLGKSLSALSSGDDITLSSSRIEAIQKEVSSGTYNRDASLIAKKMINNMKNKGV